MPSKEAPFVPPLRFFRRGFLLWQATKVESTDSTGFLRDGLQGQPAHSPGQHPGEFACSGIRPDGATALQLDRAFAPIGRSFVSSLFPGRCPGLLAHCPFGAFMQNNSHLFFCINISKSAAYIVGNGKWIVVCHLRLFSSSEAASEPLRSRILRD